MTDSPGVGGWPTPPHTFDTREEQKPKEHKIPLTLDRSDSESVIISPPRRFATINTAAVRVVRYVSQLEGRSSRLRLVGSSTLVARAEQCVFLRLWMPFLLSQAVHSMFKALRWSKFGTSSTTSFQVEKNTVKCLSSITAVINSTYGVLEWGNCVCRHPGGHQRAF